MEVIIGILGAIATSGLGYFAFKARRIAQLPERFDNMEEDHKYLRSRVDSIYEALINR